MKDFITKDFFELIKGLKEQYPHIKELEAELYDDESKEISKLVFSNRVKQGLTQTELAEKANVVGKVIHRIESGTKRGDLKKEDYQKVLDTLGIDYVMGVDTVYRPKGKVIREDFKKDK